MDVTKILLEILVLLVAAKVAAEIAERIGVPAVVGEIVAGVLIGPSVFGWVHESDVLRTLGELGVILLLLEVGLEMDLASLTRVGRASLLVATAGVVVPFVTGFGVAELLGAGSNEALFIGAALTATSVGITARVFGDLRALGTIEARTVLGAAVADDVMGLVVLTVVVKIVTQGSVSLLSVLGTVALAVGFLAIAVPLGRLLAPPVFSTVARFSRSSGTLVAIALAFTLGLSELAHAAGLAPIIGAFVAGLALTAAPPAPKIRRELAPIGHVFVPVFFLQIGIEADVSAFANGKALGLAGALLAVGILGKLAASVGMFGSAGDKLLVGIGMIPRGEVGLIFATIGLREKVFGETTFAALLIVVLVTTLVTPPVLRLRLVALQRRARGDTAVKERAFDHLDVAADPDVVSLSEEPAAERALAVAVAAARAVDRQAPSEHLLEWIGSLPPGVRRVDEETRNELFALLDEGQARAWNLAVGSGVLARLLPELSEAMERRLATAIDPVSALEFQTVGRVRESASYGTLEHPECLLLAAVSIDAVEGSESSAVAVARRSAARLGLDADGQERCARLVRDCTLFDAAARRPDALSEPSVVALAVHVAEIRDARALQVLTHAVRGDDEPETSARIDALADAVVAALGRPELAGGAAAEAERRIMVASASTDPELTERLAATPPAFVLALEPDELRSIARSLVPKPARNEVRVSVESVRDGWIVTFVALDRVGLIARQTGALLDAAVRVDSALATTWPDGVAVTRYVVRHDGAAPDADALADSVRDSMVAPLAVAAVPGAEVSFDDDSSPTWTRCRIEARDRVGLLHALASAFAAAEVSIHSASASVEGSRAVEEFEVCDRRGGKLDVATRERVVSVLRSGATVRAGRVGRGATRRQ